MKPDRELRAAQVAAFWTAVLDPEALIDGPCIEWPGGRNQAGYGHCSPATNGEGIVSRSVWHEVHGAIPSGLYVLHKCDNRPCARPAHLFLGTARDNTDDMMAKGRNRPAAGDRNGKIIVPDSYVEELRHRWLAGEHYTALAAEVGMHPASMSRLLRGQRRNITTPIDLDSMAAQPVIAQRTPTEPKHRAVILSPEKAARRERDQRMRALYESGLSTIAVGKELGLSSTVVYRRLKRLGVTFRATSDYYPERDAEQIAAEYRAGAGLHALAARHHMTTNRVSALIRSTSTQIRRPGRRSEPVRDYPEEIA